MRGFPSLSQSFPSLLVDGGPRAAGKNGEGDGHLAPSHPKLLALQTTMRPVAMAHSAATAPTTMTTNSTDSGPVSNTLRPAPFRAL